MQLWAFRQENRQSDRQEVVQFIRNFTLGHDITDRIKGVLASGSAVQGSHDIADDPYSILASKAGFAKEG